MTATELKQWAKEKWPEATEKDGQFSVGDKLKLVVETKAPGWIDVQVDENLRKVLLEEYESVSESEVFGRDGARVLLTGQIDDGEIKSLVIQSFGI